MRNGGPGLPRRSAQPSAHPTRSTDDSWFSQSRHRPARTPPPAAPAAPTDAAPAAPAGNRPASAAGRIPAPTASLPPSATVSSQNPAPTGPSGRTRLGRLLPHVPRRRLQRDEQPHRRLFPFHYAFQVPHLRRRHLSALDLHHHLLRRSPLPVNTHCVAFSTTESRMITC